MTDRIDASPLERGSSKPAPQGATLALLAGFLGWTLDAFDFFLLVMCKDKIAQEWNLSSAQMGLSLGITLLFRPVGAFIFGLLADRYGRRTPLMINLVFYSTVEVLTGFSHSYFEFMVLRALFGIGMGGEWGVGASLAMEKVPRKWRGVLSGLLQEGYAMGFLLAALVYGQVYPHWGWRPLFFIGGAPALLALVVRFGVHESEVWEKAGARDWTTLGRDILSNTKLFFYLVALMAGMSFCSHGTQDFYPDFLKTDHHYTPQRAAWITMVMQVGAILGGVIFGLYSDRIGRRRAMIIALVGAIILIPLWAFSSALAMIVAGAFLIQFMVQGAWGIIPAHLNELAPDNVRGFLPGFAYQCGIAIAASVDWIAPALKQHMGYTKGMALLAVCVFSYAIFIIAMGKERHGIEFGVDEDKSRGFDVIFKE